jgi:hypothetical protein
MSDKIKKMLKADVVDKIATYEAINKSLIEITNILKNGSHVYLHLNVRLDENLERTWKEYFGEEIKIVSANVLKRTEKRFITRGAVIDSLVKNAKSLIDDDDIDEILRKGLVIKPYEKCSNKELEDIWSRSFGAEIEIKDDRDTPEQDVKPKETRSRGAVIDDLIEIDLDGPMEEVTVRDIIRDGWLGSPYVEWSNEELENKWNNFFEDRPKIKIV